MSLRDLTRFFGVILVHLTAVGLDKDFF